MPRKPSPPRLERDRKRPSEGNWYIYWTEGGRSREHSTGTGDRDQAELYFAEWKLRRFRPDRAVEPYEFYVADAISHYLAKRLDDVSDPERLANAAKPIIRFFDGYAVGDINDALIKEYCQKRRKGRGEKGLKDGTLRRELSLLSTAIRRAEEDQLITRRIR